MQEEKVNFWLYKAGRRITGLYGAFCQFTDEPKDYVDSEEQRSIVFCNLAERFRSMHNDSGDSSRARELVANGGGSCEDLLDVVHELCVMTNEDNTKHAGSPEFDQVRVYTVGGELLASFNIRSEAGTLTFVPEAGEDE